MAAETRAAASRRSGKPGHRGSWLGESALAASVFLLGALLPAVLKVFLRAGLSWLLLAVLLGVKIAASMLAARLPEAPARTIRLLSTLYTTALAAAVLTGILITPYSAYGIWFQSVQDGQPSGVVSTLFVLLAVLFCSSFAALVFSSGVLLPVYLEFLTAAALLSVIYQSRFLYLALFALLALGSVYLSVRYVKKGSRGRNLAAFLLLFLSAAALSRLPMLLARPQGSRIVDEQLHPGLRQTVISLFPRFPLLYGIPGFGYGFSEKRLGGTPVLSEAPLFRIRGRPGERLYLRTSIFDVYDGRSWSKSAASSGRENEAGAGPPSFRALESRAVGQESIRITLLIEYYNLLPHTLDTRVVYLPAESIDGLEGSSAFGFRLASPLLQGQSIYLQQEHTGPGGGEEQATSPRRLEPADLDTLLQLPDGGSTRLRALARSLADPEGNPLRTLRNIERYLARNYTYNLQVERSSSEDFVEDFLFSRREGYCVHFASAFIALARLNGLPCRYATGFLAVLPENRPPFEIAAEPGLGTVSGLSSHAWPEVWLADRGWTAWEATTAVNPAYYDEHGESLVYEYGLEANRLTDRQLRAILGRQPISPDGKESPLRSVDWEWLLLLVPILAIGLGVFWVFKHYAFIVLAVLRPNRASALRVLAGIVSSQSRGGVDPPSKTGWVRWTRLLSPPEKRLNRLLTVIQRLAYSDRGFRKRDLRFLSAFYLRFCSPGRLARR